MKGLRINKAGAEKRAALRQHFWIDAGDVNGQIAELESRYLVDIAERLLLPIPEDSDWTDSTEASPNFYLKREAMARLRTAIRQEKNERFQSGAKWIPLLTGLTGLFGTLIGLVVALARWL